MGTYVSFVRSVGFYAIVSDNIDDIVRHTCTLFPQAYFHVIGVMHKLKSRHHYTSLYADMMHRLAKDSVLTISTKLRSQGCDRVREVILEGRPIKAITTYIKHNTIDALIVVTSSKPSAVETISPTIQQIISSVKIPILVYTPFFRFQGKERVVTLALQSLSHIDGNLSIAFSLAKCLNAQLEIITMRKVSKVQLEKFRRYLLRSNIVFGLNIIESSSMDEFVSKLLKLCSDSLILITRRHERGVSRLLGILGLHKIESYERILMSLSPVPILFI